MRGWLIFARELDPALPEVPEIFRFQDVAAAMGMELHVLNPHNFDLIVGADDDWAVKYQEQQMERPDFVLCRTGAETDYFTLALLRHFERRGIRLINGPAAIELVADKLHSLQRLIRAGLPIPRTILGKFPIDAGLIERELGFPVIVKTLKGTRGAGVLKCENRSQFEDLAGLLESADAQADFVMQHYIRASHGRDVRILVVGGRVVAAMERRSLTGGFKSNVSLGGVGVAYNPPPEMAELAVLAAETLDLDVTGIDILFDEDGYRICEANSAPGFQGLEQACGVDVPAAILGWIEATHSPVSSNQLPAESEALLDFVLGGRTGVRTISDRSINYRRFAGIIGMRLVAAGVTSLALSILPTFLTDGKSRTNVGLKTLFEGKAHTNASFFDDSEQERALIVTLIVSIWAAALPWLVGGHAAISGTISVISLLFPIIFLITAPSGRIRNFVIPPAAVKRR
ncbi:gamma-F420-2:alpha-L-glutamate ligase [Sphingobium xenophagum]|uniref:Gamma-F420-2:alpha-L-glutamate ligase n=1 Tax=Sphingobium xenophagum TaxID=121428 RepID=A0ABU1WZY4_SPHXE|nr:RimK family alpha-L-glutamate ligase [Sphingobium xenophagum]MDR7154754.1 gamma-F420-2:alpha-L-glutamate ligase [Sphingobium xenophagum]